MKQHQQPEPTKLLKLLPRPDYTKPARPENQMLICAKKSRVSTRPQAKDPAEYRAEVFGDSE